eukprot:4223184-Pleurochrysis_carterae.AAC.2
MRPSDRDICPLSVSRSLCFVRRYDTQRVPPPSGEPTNGEEARAPLVTPPPSHAASPPLSAQTRLCGLRIIGCMCSHATARSTSLPYAVSLKGTRRAA